jgi:hypothetical protein
LEPCHLVSRERRIEAAVLAGVLTWLLDRGIALSFETGITTAIGLVLLAAAIVLLSFWLGATWTGP